MKVRMWYNFNGEKDMKKEPRRVRPHWWYAKKAWQNLLVERS